METQYFCIRLSRPEIQSGPNRYLWPAPIPSGLKSIVRLRMMIKYHKRIKAVSTHTQSAQKVIQILSSIFIKKKVIQIQQMITELIQVLEILILQI